MAPRSFPYPPVSLDGLEHQANAVSVVIPSCRPPEFTLQCLESLTAQTLDSARYEIVLVVNGPQAADVSVYEGFAAAHPENRIAVVISPLTGPSHPLNLGIANARAQWMTVVDDDDTVTPGYLEGLLSVAEAGVIPLTRIDTVLQDGSVDPDNRINEQILPLQGRLVPPEDCVRGLTFNTAKLIPTDWARSIGYDTQLKSGQDVVFYGSLYAKYDFRFAIVPARFHATYLRSLTDASVSRRSGDFEFSVVERLDVIEALEADKRSAEEEKWDLLTTLQQSQTGFVWKYLADWPDERPKVIAVIDKRKLSAFPSDILNVKPAVPPENQDL